MKILNVCTLHYPHENDGEKDLSAVLTEGEADDLAVYVGYGSQDWVARKGAKVSWEMALFFFPWIPREKYRS